MSALAGRKDGHSFNFTEMELTMVLKRKAPAEFEPQQTTAVQEPAAQPGAKPPVPDSAPWTEEEAAAAPAATTAVAPAKTAALVTAPKQGHLVAAQVPKVNMNHVKELKDKFTVQYDSLAQLQASQGQFMDRESGLSLGAELLFELLSFQEQFVVTPNDNRATKEVVRYSSDGITCSDGTDVKQHLADLRELGWANARVNARYIIVGSLLAAEKTDSMDGTLVQIDLSPKSRSQFDRYLIQSAYDLAKGLITEAQSTVLDLTAQVAKNAKGDIYTVVKFNTHVDPAPAA